MTYLKRLILLTSCVIINSALFGQGEIKKVNAFDVHADIDGYKYYLLDSLICSSEYDTISKREIFREVTEWPVFRNSIPDLFKYIRANLKYQSFDAGFYAKVIVQFVVEIDGTLSNFKILRGLEPIYDKEAINVLKNMPKWTSGKCNGEKVPTYFVVPINFRLQ